MSLGHTDPENPGSAADGISDHGMSKYLPLLELLADKPAPGL